MPSRPKVSFGHPTKNTNPFYKTAAWEQCREMVLIRDHYLCQPCLRRGRLTQANTVHHKMPLGQAPELALDPDNLESICPVCHNREHPEKGKTGKLKEERKRRARIIETKANPDTPPLA